MRVAGLLTIVALLTATSAPASAGYLWRNGAASDRTLESSVPVPEGFRRIPVREDSFAEWLRGLPMHPPGTPVRLHDGRLKPAQVHHVAVVDIDVGKRDLQQCADAVMRLRAEWLLSRGQGIAFNYTNGKRSRFSGGDYRSFQRYMTLVFAYAGTASLEREMIPVASAGMAIGDVFIKGGFPGHAMLVADMIVNETTGEKRFLLLQSYMPAQDMHIVKNPAAGDGSPWFPLPLLGPLVTPEWTFAAESLRSFDKK